MNLSLLKENLAVCQLAPDAPVPAWTASAASFLSITRTSEELSIVCTAALVPAGVERGPAWRAFKVDGPLDFALTGILVAIAAPLAAAGISIFALATYNTDYVLVRADKMEAAVQALRSAGHTVRMD